MQTKKSLFLYLGILPTVALLLLTSGCAVDNEVLAKMPLFEAKSDRIPGLTPPHKRKELIREKGKQGAKAKENEKETLVAQLMVEYRTSPDPNMRREAVDAMAKIPHPKRDEYLKEILQDADPFVRISSLEALSRTYSGSPSELAAILQEHLKRDPDKDVRLISIRLLGDSFAWQAKKKGVAATPELRDGALAVLGEALYDKVPAVRYEAMQSLHKVSGKDYGTDINRWMQYARHVKGESTEAPQERSFAEKLPKIHLPMLK